MIQKVKNLTLNLFHNKTECENKERQLKQNIRDLERQVSELRIQLEQEQDRPPQPTPTLQDLLEEELGGIEWFDYNELDPPQLDEYHRQATYILRSNIFDNELNFLKSNWGKQALLEAHNKSKENNEIQEHIQKMSWMVLGIHSFKERLKEVPNPNKPQPTTDNLNASI